LFFKAKHLAVAYYREGHFITLRFPNGACDVVPVFNLLPLHFNHAVAILQSDFLGYRACGDLSHFRPLAQANKLSVLLELLNEVMRYRYFNQLSAAVDCKRGVGSNQVVWPEDVEIVVKILTIYFYNLISLLEAEVLRQRTDLYFSCPVDVVLRHIDVRQKISNADKDQDADDDVDCNAAEHDDQALPGGVTPEFVRFRWLHPGVGVERFVDHP